MSEIALSREGQGGAAAAFEFSTEEERRSRKRDYAVEISRLMGKQLAKGLRRDR